MDGRLGETRVVRFMVENNHPNDTEITFRATDWVDAHGHEYSENPVMFEPENITLPSGQSAIIQAITSVAEPLKPGIYVAYFFLEGCPAKPISVGMRIQDEGWLDHYAVCDACRGCKGYFVEFCHDCGHGAGCTCGHSNHWDPHHHWHEEYCTRYYLSN